MARKTREQLRTERLTQELAAREAEKAAAPPVSRHAEKITNLIGAQPRPMPEAGEREEPIQINQEFMQDLIMQNEEEIGAKTFISIPSAKILKEQRTEREQKQQETDNEWAEVRRALIRNAIKARPKGTWRTYEDKQEAFMVLTSRCCYNLW
jgi:hypothetical protein